MELVKIDYTVSDFTRNSISTALPRGKLLTPIAKRLCFPASLKILVSMSDAALITLGWSMKVGSELTYPDRRMNRFTLSKLPNADLTCERALRVQLVPRVVRLQC